MSTIFCTFLALVYAANAPCDIVTEKWEILDACEIGSVWAGHPVGFFLLTVSPYQYVAFYDADRQMVVGQRKLDESHFRFKKLPTSVGWDSHNSIALAVDKRGCLHVSGNMHVTPLIYFRMTAPHNLESLIPVHRMVGVNEDRVTYPRFISTPEGDLVFYYRDGASGRGRQLFNIYDVESQSWRRLLPVPLLDGGEQMSAYPSGPILGPDGLWHLCWMWRDTPDCSTNHDISYARSRDLVHWETVDGTPLTPPITAATPGVIVDPVPVKLGLINVGHHVGFDTQHRPIVTYHKYDQSGRSQIYNARWEKDRWVIYQTSNWEYRWEFSGGGSIGIEISPGPVRIAQAGYLVQTFKHSQYGSGTWVLDEETLRPIDTCRHAIRLPGEITRRESEFPGMEVRFAWDSGEPPGKESYLLKWETLPPNRDRPRPGPLPPPSTLRLYHLRRVP
ncbi:BNR repeat-containing protein [Thermogutta sp.]|uniref:BNR repeat-containing protein n=1 Tax=Thermogutta sp. TaxID=1962930 RepID=UPI00322082D0